MTPNAGLSKQKILSVFGRELRMQRIELEQERNFLLTEKSKTLNTQRDEP